MPAQLDDIIAEIDRLLEPGRFQDFGPNGLQVPGPSEVRALATGVSAHAQLFERAAAEDVQLLLVHHGLFWGSGFRIVDAALKHRLRLLFEADIALAGYHLPLDAHPELGNNALIARALGAQPAGRFADYNGEAIGMLARFAGEGIGLAELAANVRELTSREPLVFDFGPERIRLLAVISGAGSDWLADAAAAGADAFLTGEPAERVMAEARESRLHFVAAGHYATETFGIRRLGEHLAERFALRHVFLEVPNPI